MKIVNGPFTLKELLEMEKHPMCQLFPPLSQAEMLELSQSIQEVGLQQPITILKDLNNNFSILDGQNRIAAMGMSNFSLESKPYARILSLTTEETGKDKDHEINEKGAAKFVLAKNITRRHLSAAQRAEIALKLMPPLRGKGIKDEHQDAATTSTVREVADAAGVSPRTVQAAASQAKNGDVKKDKPKKWRDAVPHISAQDYEPIMGDHDTEFDMLVKNIIEEYENNLEGLARKYVQLMLTERRIKG